MDNSTKLDYPPPRSKLLQKAFQPFASAFAAKAREPIGRRNRRGRGAIRLRGARFANAVLWGGALLTLLGAGFASPWGGPVSYPSPRAGMITTGLLALSACLALCTRLPLSARVSIALALVGGFLALYSTEAFLQWREATKVRHAANRLGRPYDRRSGAQVLRDLRHSGQDAWPAMSVGDLLRGQEELPLLPLGGISGVPTRACNELGAPLVYPSDARGFLNPPGSWEPAPLDVAMLGDSFARGDCVAAEESAAAR